ncbi:MAG: hypothetical protein NTU73_07830, partial [Ignavibacteriae bacterium]|nr:hypothetical protein [Ignavibacteriota bacterium]
EANTNKIESDIMYKARINALISIYYFSSFPFPRWSMRTTIQFVIPACLWQGSRFHFFSLLVTMLQRSNV